jgi:hypothetical protein
VVMEFLVFQKTANYKAMGKNQPAPGRAARVKRSQYAMVLPFSRKIARPACPDSNIAF